jgi:prepilin-type N-terminal cleavage/methylation domain-containing protein
MEVPVLRNKKGFTLIEMLIAMMVILIAMMGLYKTVTVTIEGNVQNVLRDEGVKIAEQVFNEIRMLDYDKIPVASPWTKGAGNDWENTLGYFPPIQRRIRKQTDVEYEMNVYVTETGEVKQVTVIVGWDHKGENTTAKATNDTGKEFEVTLSTIKR